MSKQPKKVVSEQFVNKLKKQAKSLKKKHSINQAQALDYVAKNNGFGNWKEVVSESRKQHQIDRDIPAASFKFLDDKFKLDDTDLNDIALNRSIDLSDESKLLVNNNRALLAELGIEYSIFEPTTTGLKKSILDATQPVRFHFKLENFHTYDTQQQGPDFKVKKEAKLLTIEGVEESKVSLYRPKTKSGDPRMWFTKLPYFSKAGDKIAIIISDDIAHLVNLSKINLNEIAANNPISDFLKNYQEQVSVVSNELYEKLQVLAKNKLKAIKEGNTAIGMTIEAALGIQANSSKEPDYKGIELKSGRGTKTRTTIFAQVADWGLSTCKKSAEILDKYGYFRGEEKKLYCTITTQRENPQKLMFKYDEKNDLLHEYYDENEHVATWTGDLLRERLLEKHAETFWIEADSEYIDGVEYFQLKSVTHTKAPLCGQLMQLISEGVITMDHLIKRTAGEKPKVSEKGPLFKIDKKNLNLLFPKPEKHSLI